MGAREQKESSDRGSGMMCVVQGIQSSRAQCFSRGIYGIVLLRELAERDGRRGRQRISQDPEKLSSTGG